MDITYALWVPREGMRGWFRDLSAVWANPNSRMSQWPLATLAVVCERGEPKPIVCDPHARVSRVYALNPKTKWIGGLSYSGVYSSKDDES